MLSGQRNCCYVIGIPAENLLDIYIHYWESGELQQDFNDELIVNTYKRKRDREDCGKYRVTSLLAIASQKHSADFVHHAARLT